MGLAGGCTCPVAGCRLCFGTGGVTGSPDQVFELRRESVRAPGVGGCLRDVLKPLAFAAPSMCDCAADGTIARRLTKAGSGTDAVVLWLPQKVAREHSCTHMNGANNTQVGRS